MDRKVILVFAFILAELYTGHCKPQVKAMFPRPVNRKRFIVLNTDGFTTMTNFTICHWLKATTFKSKLTIFSYATNADPDTIKTWIGNVDVETKTPSVTMDLFGGAVRVSATHTVLKQGEWRHVCFVWSTSTTSGAIYISGGRVTNVKIGGRDLGGKGKLPIPAKGIAIIGQDQDTVGGAFDEREAYEGELFDLQIWDRALSEKEITESKLCNPSSQGNIYSWMSSETLFRGGIILSRTSLCSL